MIERLRIRILVALAWRSRPRLLTTLRNFSETEADSAWHLLRAAELSSDPAEKADLFGQVLEEMRHAEEFAKLHKDLGGGRMKPVKPERRPLVETPEDLWRFHVFCQIGEGAAATRFKNIHDALRDPELRPLKKVLRQILRDEAQHVHGAAELAKASAVPPRTLRKEAGNVRARRAWQAWMRSGRHVTNAFGTLVLAVVYPIVGVLGRATARKRLGMAADAPRRAVAADFRLLADEAR